jgi:hypothetical protein
MEPALPFHLSWQNAIFRASCRATEIKLSIQRGSGAVLTIKRPRTETQGIEIPEQDVATLVAEFQAIGEDPEKFEAFVNAAESAYQLRHEQLGKPFPDFFGAMLQG